MRTIPTIVSEDMTATPDFIYLASQSPRRSQLLDQLGVRHQLLLADADEDAEALEVQLRNEAPKTYVQRVTGLKLEAALQRMARRKLPTAPVLCADTTVALGRTIFGKPEDAEDAKRMLRALANRPHRVMTAVAVGWEHGQAHACSESWVTFGDLSEADIAAYAQRTIRFTTFRRASPIDRVWSSRSNSCQAGQPST